MKTKKKMGKKGNVLIDMIIVPIILFFILISFFLGYYVYDLMKTETTLFNGELDGGSATQGEIRNSIDVTTGMFPYLFIMVVASVLIVILLTAYLIESSVVFVSVGFIILMISILISVPIANFYEEFTDDSEFSDTSDQFLVANVIMLNLPYFVFIMGAVFILILFGKKGGGHVPY